PVRKGKVQFEATYERRLPIDVADQQMAHQANRLRPDRRVCFISGTHLGIEQHASRDNVEPIGQAPRDREFYTTAPDGADLLEQISGIETEIGPAKIEQADDRGHS